MPFWHQVVAMSEKISLKMGVKFAVEPNICNNSRELLNIFMYKSDANEL